MAYCPCTFIQRLVANFISCLMCRCHPDINFPHKPSPHFHSRLINSSIHWRFQWSNMIKDEKSPLFHNINLMSCCFAVFIISQTYAVEEHGVEWWQAMKRKRDWEQPVTKVPSQTAWKSSKTNINNQKCCFFLPPCPLLKINFKTFFVNTFVAGELFISLRWKEYNYNTIKFNLRLQKRCQWTTALITWREIHVCRCLNNSTGVLFAITISVLTEPFVDYPSGRNRY